MTDLLSLDDLTSDDLDRLFTLAIQAKRGRVGAALGDAPLAGRTIALLFEKPSLRTRVSFEVAARELGAQSIYLSPQEVGLGQREAVGDVARVLSSYVHAVVLRTHKHSLAEEFARYATVPLINGLTDRHHPCQGLTDAFTIVEYLGEAGGRTLAYVGDGNNVAHSLIQVAAKLGMHIRVASPPGYEPDAEIAATAKREAVQHGGSLSVSHDPEEAAHGADVLYTDVWTSMGQEGEKANRERLFAPYRIDAHILSLAAADAIVLHPMPAHRGEEIADEVLDGPRSRAFVQAENRLHVQKAILELLLLGETKAVTVQAILSA
ncbi:MAG: ornithine carbamoyltransferase [Ktedonobacterales bacterium]